MKTSTKLWIGLGALTLLTPLGMIARGTAWGEWTSTELHARLPFIPEGFQKWEGLWKPKMDHYTLPGPQAPVRSPAAYLVSAAAGVLILTALGWAVGRWLARGRQRRASPDGHRRPHDS